MNLLNLLLFYSTWSFIVFLIYLMANAESFGPLVKKNMSTLILIVLIGSLVLNIHYLTFYTVQQNIQRIPYEIVFHYVSLAYLVYTKMEVDMTDIKSYILSSLLMVVYLGYFGIKNVLNFYYDPLKYVN